MLRSEEYEIQTSGSGRAGLHRRKRTFRLQEGNETAGRGAYILLCWTGLCPDRRTAEYRRGWHHINGKRDKQEQGRLCLDDLTGASLTSGKNLILYAKGDIRLDSGKVINMETLSGIFAEALAAATSSMCVNGRFDYLSAGTLLKGSTYLAYDPFDDAPKEGKFDWGGFFRNLAIGLAVFAVCAAFAVASVMTAGAVTVAGGALIGAAIGALTTTISISVEDFNSGNVRSAGDAMLQIGMSAISGAITGAIGAKFPNMNKLLAGLIDTAVGTFERGVVAAVTEDMTFGEWLAYTFDPRTILIDFAAGVLIDFAIDGIAKFFKGKGGAQLADGIADQLSEGVEDGVNREIRDSLGDAGSISGNRGHYSFDLDGNEVTCMLDYCDITNLRDIELSKLSGQSIFYNVDIENVGNVYVSTGTIKQSNFASIVDQSSGNVSIISGAHGGVDGSLLNDVNGISGRSLFEEDIRVWGNAPNVSIVDINTLSAADLKQIIASSDVTICAWCYSERAKILLEALGFE